MIYTQSLKYSHNDGVKGWDWNISVHVYSVVTSIYKTGQPPYTFLPATLYRVYLLHLLCSGNTFPGTEFRELHFLLVVPWKVFPEQIIVEVLGPQRAYRPEISRQGCLQGCGCGGRRQYYCFRFNMNLVIHPIETPPRLLAGRGGGVLSQGP